MIFIEATNNELNIRRNIMKTSSFKLKIVNNLRVGDIV